MNKITKEIHSAKQKSLEEQKNNQDHRVIAKELDLYILDDKAGQGLLILLPD